MNAYRFRQIWQSLGSRRRAWFYRALGMQIEGRVWLAAIEWPARPQCVALETGVALDLGVTLLATNDAARIRIGRNCYVNRHSMIDASELVEIGPQTMIGPFCYITDHDHVVGPGKAPGDTPLITSPTRIGSGCWIGAHVSVLKGVKVGDGAVIGAGSVVTRDISPAVVAVGSPAVVIRELKSP